MKKIEDIKNNGYVKIIKDGKDGFGCTGRWYNRADIIRELCKKNNIVQMVDFKDYNFKFRKG